MKDLTDEYWMQKALACAQEALDQDEIPIGAVLVCEDTLIAQGFNQREILNNPLKHAEMVLLEKASQKKANWRLKDCSLYVTVEPCPMCLGALLQARVGRLVFGCADPKRPPLEYFSKKASWVFPTLDQVSTLRGNNHVLTVVPSVLKESCQQILKDFFSKKRFRNKKKSQVL